MCVISDSPFSMKEESIKWLFGSIRTNYIHITYNDIHTDGGRAIWLRLGDIRESWETRDSREEEDTQWRQVFTLYKRILRKFSDSVYFVRFT